MFCKVLLNERTKKTIYTLQSLALQKIENHLKLLLFFSLSKIKVLKLVIIQKD